MSSPGSSRLPLAVFFALVGFLPANWVVRLPDVKDQVDTSASGLGVALLLGSLGGVVATPLAGRLCARLGNRPVLVPSAALLCVVTVVPAFAGSVRWLGGTLILVGLVGATFNVALNSAAVETSSAAGAPLMPTLHGVFSVGGLLGAVVGGFAAERLTPAGQLLIVGLFGLVLTALAGPAVLRGAPARTLRPEHRRLPAAEWKAHRAVVTLFGVVAFCTAYSEFASNNWATLHLREDLGATPAVAAYGYASYACAIAVGRFAGSRLIRRHGDTAVLSGGFLLAAAGVLTANWAGHLTGWVGGGLAVAFAGYIALGLGLANVYPIAISRAGSLAGPRGVSRVSLVASLGILGQAPAIGFLADRLGLPAALSTVAVLSVVAAFLGLALRERGRVAVPAAARSGPAGVE